MGGVAMGEWMVAFFVGEYAEGKRGQRDDSV